VTLKYFDYFPVQFSVIKLDLLLFILEEKEELLVKVLKSMQYLLAQPFSFLFRFQIFYKTEHKHYSQILLRLHSMVLISYTSCYY